MAVFGCPPLVLRMTDFWIFTRVSLQTFTTSIQLNEMQVGLLVNQRYQIVLYVNARPHVYNMILQRLIDLGYETLQHTQYSPEISSTEKTPFQAY